MRKIIFLTALLTVLYGCGAKKTYEKTVETKLIDSTIRIKETLRTPPILSTLVIDEICDTTTQRPKKFNQSFVFNGDTLKLSLQNNQLRFEIEQLQKEIKRKDSIAVNNKQETVVKESTEIVRYRLDWRWILGALAVGFGIGFLRPWKYIKP